MFRPRHGAVLLALAVLVLVPPVALAQDAGHHDPADVEKAFPRKAPYSP